MWSELLKNTVLSGMEWKKWIKRGLGVSGEIEIWKMGKIRTIFEKCDRKKKKYQI